MVLFSGEGVSNRSLLPESRGLLRVCALIVLFGSLWGSSPALAESTDREYNADSLSAAAVAFHLRYAASPDSSSTPPDRWLARDKARHVVFSGLWTLSTQYVLVNKADWSKADALPASVASATAVGAAKELYDASRSAGRASGKDLVADAVGIGLAVGLIVL